MKDLQTVLTVLTDSKHTEPTWNQLDEAITIVKQMMQAEPVLYQRRMKPDYGPCWTHWDDCSEATFKECLRVPKLHDWTYEARALYAAPKAPQAVPAVYECFKNGTLCARCGHNEFIATTPAVKEYEMEPHDQNWIHGEDV